MTTEDRIPRELRERMAPIAASLSDDKRVIFYQGIILAMEYFAGELGSLMTALDNAKPHLTEMPRTVRR